MQRCHQLNGIDLVASSHHRGFGDLGDPTGVTPAPRNSDASQLPDTEPGSSSSTKQQPGQAPASPTSLTSEGLMGLWYRPKCLDLGEPAISHGLNG